MHHVITKNEKEINVYITEKDDLIKKNNFRFDVIFDEILSTYKINIGEYDFIGHEYLKNLHVYKLTGEFLQ